MLDHDTAIPPDLFQIDLRDAIATALHDLPAGQEVQAGEARFVLREAVPFGHKVATVAVAPGEAVLKFGFPIGVATAPIRPGDWVHTHNVATALASTGAYVRGVAPVADAVRPAGGFAGYRRADGRVATRNEIWVLPTVGCVARTASKIAERADRLHAGRIDGMYAFTHPSGCSQLGDDLDATRNVLAGLASHPNAAGVLLVGLGCEENQLAQLLAAIDPAVHPRIRTVAAQFAGDEVEEGLTLVKELVALAETATRERVPLSELVLGVKCGGSDGFSGLTANPLVGRMSDAVTQAGGATVLTEIPEIFGAEQLLMARVADDAVFDGIVALATRKPGWIDFDAGTVLTDGVDAAAAALLATVRAVASGTDTAAERNGEREIAIWKRGVTL